MKRIILILTLAAIFFSACNLNKDRKLSQQEVEALAKAHSDSIAVVLDSLRQINVFIPPLYDKEIFDSTTTTSFFDLAKATNGELKLLVNSKLITTEIIDIIKSHASDNADLLILMDKTGSMDDDIANVQKGLTQIINTIKTYHNVRLGIALYGDKNEDGPDWFSFKNFETNYASAKEFINQVEVTGGGDYPESVYDGFFKACEQNFWKSDNKRMIILVGDAPSLEKPLSDYTVSDVIKKATENKIVMNFYPIVVTPVLGEEGAGGEGVAPVKTYEKAKLITTVYPNPAVGMVNIDFAASGKYTVQVYDNSGTLIASENVTGNQWKKDVSGFKNGVYVVRVINEDKKFETSKFIVLK